MGLFGLYFTEQKPVRYYREVMQANIQKFIVFFQKLLDLGIYIAPSAFEAGFLSLAHKAQDIDRTLDAFDEALAQL